MYIKYWGILLSLSGILILSCGSAEKSDKDKTNSTSKTYRKFNGNYNSTFNDLPDLHIDAATQNGVGPLESRADTALYADELIRIPAELELYKVDKLKHSMPLLVPKASKLLSDICANFRDSLMSKKMPLYKPIVTSIIRTNDDVKGLAKKNGNASENSPHRYGTTFDIAWARFEKTNPTDERILDDGRLKAVLGQVLNDLRERERCYIKHEKKQACFHITVR